MLLSCSQQSAPSLEHFYLALLLCNEPHFKGNCEKRQGGPATSLPSKPEGEAPGQHGPGVQPAGFAGPRRRLPGARAGGERHREAPGSFASPVPPTVKDSEPKDAKSTVDTALGVFRGCLFAPAPISRRAISCIMKPVLARLRALPRSQPLLETESLCSAELLCQRAGCGYFWKPNWRC